MLDAPPKPAAAKAAASAARPFVGLRPFTFEDRGFFFGRSEQVDVLAGLVATNRLVTVVGSSGSGKSSLIRAGLLPRLAAERVDGAAAWSWIEMRPGEAPIRHLAEALARPNRSAQAGDDDPLADARADRIELVLHESSFGLSEALAMPLGLPGKRCLILVDQFEEVFRFAALRAQQGGDEARALEQRDEATFFIQLLLAAAEDQDFPGRIVLTMRSDFIGDCARFHGLSEAVTQSQYLVPALTRDQRATAVRAPVLHAAGSIEPALVQRVLNDTNEDPDQLPVLQHAMMRCWQRATLEARGGAPALTLAQYLAVGGVQRALSLHAEEVLAELERDQIGGTLPAGTVTKRLFQSLTDTDSQGRVTRRPQSFKALVDVLVDDDAAARAAAEAAMGHVVRRFADPGCSFLRADVDLRDESIVDIGHEALIRRWDRLGRHRERNWVREEQEDGERYRDLLRLARIGGIVPAYELPSFERWWEERRPTRSWAARYSKDASDRLEAAAGVLRESRAAIDRERRKRRQERRNLALVVAAALAVLAFGAYRYWQLQLHAAERQAIAAGEARSRLIAVLGADALDRESANKALLIALYGLEGKDGLPFVPEIEALAYGVLDQLRERMIIPASRYSAHIVFAPDGTLVTMASQVMRFWDPATGRLKRPDLRLPNFGYNLTLSPDGTRALVGGQDQAHIIDLATGATTLLGSRDSSGGPGVFSPDGQLIITGGRSSSPKLWRVERPAGGGAAEYFLARDYAQDDPPLVSATATAFSPQSNFFAVGAEDGVVHLFAADGSPIKDLPYPPYGRGEEGGNRNVVSLVFDPNDANTLLAVYPSLAYLWNLDQQSGLPLPEHKGVLLRGAFSPDGNYVATGSGEGLVHLWNRRRLRPDTVMLLRAGLGNIRSLAFSPKPPYMLATASDHGEVWLWDVQSALSRGVTPAADEPPKAPPPTAALETATMTVDAVRREVVVTSSHPGDPPRTLHLPSATKPPELVAMSADRSWVALAPREGQVLLFDVRASDRPIAVLGESSARWRQLDFADKPDRLVATTPSGRERAWRYFPDRQGLIDFAKLALPTEDGRTVALSPGELCKLRGTFGVLAVASRHDATRSGCE
jgi:WD40 repeat protein